MMIPATEVLRGDVLLPERKTVSIITAEGTDVLRFDTGSGPVYVGRNSTQEVAERPNPADHSVRVLPPSNSYGGYLVECSCGFTAHCATNDPGFATKRAGEHLEAQFVGTVESVMGR